MRSANEVAGLVYRACADEVAARKVGNVYPGAPFEEMTAADFLASAAAARDAWRIELDSGAATVGGLILSAVEARRRVTSANTNLGLAILLAPMALAATRGEFAAELPAVLNGLSVADAVLAYRAIRLANPGGLGTTSEADVAGEPAVTLLEAMRFAEGRDAIARQYAADFADVLGPISTSLRDGHARFGSREGAVLHAQLDRLAGWPDSLIARKRGPQVAESVRAEAEEVCRAGGLATAAGRRLALRLDRRLRNPRLRLNPGTTADLLGAALFAWYLDGGVPEPFAWGDGGTWLAPETGNE